ncbi:MAG: RnfABCDGE type electron transport complex subunit B [Alistipes sp.]|nr:RnfABCDGE type electron transport complex subunit B [Candidatus Alistipes equi]
MSILIYTVLTLSLIGVVAAAVLYGVSKKFHVEEDERIDSVATMLPGANCGGCGFAGCRAMAEALVKEEDISGLFCPVGGNACMSAIASLLGKTPAKKDPQVATLKCGGTCDKRPKTTVYDGAHSCAIQASLYTGESTCPDGCIGEGDCVKVCQYGALSINPQTGLAQVDAEKCTACGACVKACPRHVLELRKRWPKNKAVYVGCSSRQKGPLTIRACKAGCIGCGKCAKVCQFEAITIENNLAYIDSTKCRLCRKCYNECPTKAIKLIGLEPLAVKTEEKQ